MKRAAAMGTLMLSVAASVMLGELGLRWLDGFRLTSARLVLRAAPAKAPTPLTVWPTAGANAIAAPHLDAIPVPAGVDRGWFFSDPPPPAAKPPRPDLELLSAGVDPTLGKFARRIWNRNFVLGQARRRESYWEYLKQIRTPLRVFDPPDHSEYPRYRMIPDDPHAEAWPTGTMVSNNLGYRGRDVSVVKPFKTFRIVFVGASTTIDHPSFPLSFTDYVGHYLNRWAQARGLAVTFETINTAREGLQSTDLAAVVEQEVRGLAPDVVVYKEGANQFGEAKRLLTVADQTVKPITPDFLINGVVNGAPRNYHFDARRRWDAFVAGFRPLDEAPRPAYEVHWPAGLSEAHPDLARRDLPLELPTILRDLNRIEVSLRPLGAEFAVSSFVWMADDHLRLVAARPNERAIYWYLNGNEVVWPLHYRDIRRFADFQNTVFRDFSTASGASFVDLARWFPRDPALFIDGIHISYAGLKLHGWVTFLELLPLIERRLDTHAVTLQVPDSPPAFSTTTVADIEKTLAAGAAVLPLPQLNEWRAASPSVRLTLSDGHLSVVGTATRWEYQLLSPPIVVDTNRYYQVALPTTVSSGAIGVGVLDTSGHTWISSPLDSAPFTFFSGPNHTVQLVVADATPTAGTVTRNVFEIQRPPR